MKHILIIEDNPIYQIKINSAIQELGHKTQVISTLTEAEKHFEKPELYHLIICDIMLKDGSAFDLKHWPKLPIIFITAFEEIDYMNASLKIENSLFLTKPFSDLTLKSYILRLLDKQSIELSNQHITVFGKHKNPIKILISDILFVTSEGNYSTIVTEGDKKYVTKRSAKFLINDYIAKEVVRISRSTFINRSKLTSVHIAKNTVVVGNHILAVSKNFKKNIYEFHYLDK
jgi:two-component system, LytTR family, response regulator LytT